MTRAHTASLGAFLLFAGAGLAGFLSAPSYLLGALIFAGAAVVGAFVAGLIFDRLASLEEKRRDLEDRLRNSD